MILQSILAMFFIGTGVLFFLAGSVGLIRFPDIFTRLHAATKADNVGLALLIIGISICGASFLVWVKLMIIWLILAVSSATSGNLIIQKALQNSSLKEKIK